jgi:hypothetical protein
MFWWIRQKLGRPSKKDLERDRLYQRSDAILVFMEKVFVYHEKSDRYVLRSKTKLTYHEMDKIIRQSIGVKP